MEITLSTKDLSLLRQVSRRNRRILLEGFRRGLEDPFLSEVDKARTCALAVGLHRSLNQDSDPPGPTWALDVMAAQADPAA